MLLRLLLFLTATVHSENIIAVQGSYGFSNRYSYGIEYTYRPDYSTGIGLELRKYPGGYIISPRLTGYAGDNLLIGFPIPSLIVKPDYKLTGLISVRIGYWINIDNLKISPFVSFDTTVRLKETNESIVGAGLIVGFGN